MADWAAWLGIAETLGIGAFAVVLALRGVKKLDIWLITFGILEFSVASLFFLLPAALDYDPPAYSTLVLAFHRILFATVLLTFTALYPLYGLSPRRAWFLAWALIPGAFVLVTFAASPDAFALSGGGASPLFAKFAQFVNGTAQFLFVLVFGLRWVQAGQGTYRRQFLYLLLSLVFAGLNDPLLRFAELREAGSATLLTWLEGGLSVLQLTWVLALAAWTGWNVVRRPREDARDDRAFVAWFAAFIPLALVQFAGEALGSDRLHVHLAADLAAILLFVYGVARYHVLDVDLGIRWGVRGGVLGTGAVAIVLVVQQVVEQSIGTRFGLLTGALLAGVALFLLLPLQRVAERLGRRPAGDDEQAAYAAHRRLELYEVALEGVLRDGVVEPREAKALASLRQSLGVTLAQHDLLERDVRRRMDARPGM